ncbi:hypothetical protein [Pelobacter propionicus]|uniref:hypothetical protein n=1 Tax=Pelobacter propionicus TaxID=29543 RepID=UPI000057ABC2|nr:hypothetical protein [Pelobacter propionicus]
MPPFVEFIVITIIMLGAFFLVFLLMYLFALVLFPIERSISNAIWSHQAPPPVPQKSSFRDFSKKH